MIIVGGGMIAREFATSEFANTLIFASGVPTSTKVKKNNYKKELDLLKSNLKKHSNLTLIYFSTLSVMSFSYTEYIKHKIFMEQFIEYNFKKHLILRLPNVVGNTNNQLQLLPFLYHKLVSNEKILVKKNTYRDLIDVSDLPKVVNYLISNNYNGKFNISFQNKILVSQIIEIIAEANHIKSKNLKFVPNDESNCFNGSSLGDIDFTKKLYDLNLNPDNIIIKYFKK